MRQVLTACLLIALLLPGTLAPAAAQDDGRWLTHVVQPEENLFRIALRYNLTVEAVMAANGLPDPDHVMVGQALLIPLGDSAAPTPSAPVRTTVLGGSVMHTIAAGETAAHIAAQYGVTLDALLAANGLSGESTLRAGQTLVIPLRASDDLGLIGVAPVTAPAQHDPGAASGFTQPDLGLIGVESIPVPVAPRDEAPAQTAQEPETSLIQVRPGPVAPTTDSAYAPGPAPACEEGCDTDREMFRAAMRAAAAEVTGANDDPAPQRVDDLGILAVDAAAAAPNTTGGDPAVAPAREPDLGIITPEIARLLGAGVIALNNDNLRRIYLRGLAQGNNPHAFSMIGDCNSEPPFFLTKFDRGEYDLGPFAHLQPVIDHFAGSFDRNSATVWTGNHVWALFDATWSNPAQCRAGETPLECEFRIQKPSIVLIRLGTNEANSPQMFEEHLRRVIEFALERGTIPVLGTKADRLEGDDSINAIIRRLADEYTVPLWDFSKAADQVPARGLLPDSFHMTYFPPDYSQPLALQSGHGMQNLTALLALDAVWRAVAR